MYRMTGMEVLGPHRKSLAYYKLKKPSILMLSCSGPQFQGLIQERLEQDRSPPPPPPHLAMKTTTRANRLHFQTPANTEARIINVNFTFQNQTILSLLAEIEAIHIIASIDHINAPLSKYNLFLVVHRPGLHSIKCICTQCHIASPRRSREVHHRFWRE